jgi:hypothetical protein
MNRNRFLQTTDKTNIILDKGKLEYIDNEQIASTINSVVKGFHIYVLSDEQIKVNDYYYDSISNLIRFCDTEHREALLKVATHLGNKKIIQTTDNTLNFNSWSIITDIIEKTIPQLTKKEIEYILKNTKIEYLCQRCNSNTTDECWSAKECSDGKYDKLRITTTINENL